MCRQGIRGPLQTVQSTTSAYQGSSEVRGKYTTTGYMYRTLLISHYSTDPNINYVHIISRSEQNITIFILG